MKRPLFLLYFLGCRLSFNDDRTDFVAMLLLRMPPPPVLMVVLVQSQCLIQIGMQFDHQSRQTPNWPDRTPLNVLIKQRFLRLVVILGVHAQESLLVRWTVWYFLLSF